MVARVGTTVMSEGGRTRFGAPRKCEDQTYDSEEEAQAALEKRIREKQKAGYEEKLKGRK